jgi:hypothetical protein
MVKASMLWPVPINLAWRMSRNRPKILLSKVGKAMINVDLITLRFWSFCSILIHHWNLKFREAVWDVLFLSGADEF